MSAHGGFSGEAVGVGVTRCAGPERSWIIAGRNLGLVVVCEDVEI